MEEEPTLQIHLFKNILTDKKETYIARPFTLRTVGNEDIARTISEGHTAYTPDMIREILELADRIKRDAILQGDRLTDSLGQYQLMVRGVFKASTAPFDPKQHSLSVSYIPSKEFMAQLGSLKVTVNKQVPTLMTNRSQEHKTKE